MDDSKDRPHDRFFKRIFGDVENARDFLENYLPAEVLERVDLSTLRPGPGSYVDESLKEVLTDLVFEAGVVGEEDVYVYILFEHKSYDERYVLLQVLKAMVMIWDGVRKRGAVQDGRPDMGGEPGEGAGAVEVKRTGDSLPVVIPFVVYHGERKPRFPRRLEGLFGPRGDLLRYVPEFGYEFLNIRGLSDDEIRGAAEVRAGLLIMRHIFGSRLAQKLPEILRLAAGVGDPGRRRSAIKELLWYTVKATRDSDREMVVRAVSEGLGTSGEDIMPTIAEQWLNEGMQKGMEEGMQKGMQKGMIQTARESVLEVLRVRFSEAPGDIEAALQEIESRDVLKRLHASAVVAKDVEAFRVVLRETMK